MFRKLKQLSRLNDTYLKKAEKRIKQYEKWLKPKRSFLTKFLFGKMEVYKEIDPKELIRQIWKGLMIHIDNELLNERNLAYALSGLPENTIKTMKFFDKSAYKFMKQFLESTKTEKDENSELILEEHIDVTGLTTVRLTSKDKTKVVESNE